MRQKHDKPYAQRADWEATLIQHQLIRQPQLITHTDKENQTSVFRSLQKSIHVFIPLAKRRVSTADLVTHTR